MGYDRDDSFNFDFEPNGIPFISKWKGKLSSRSYPVQFEKKWKSSFFSLDQLEYGDYKIQFDMHKSNVGLCKI